MRVRLDLLWIRCGGCRTRAESADLVIRPADSASSLRSGRYAPRSARAFRSSWFRLRRAVENTATAIVVAAEPLAKTCASLVLEMRRGAPDWSGKLMRGIEAGARRSKPLWEMRDVRLHSGLG